MPRPLVGLIWLGVDVIRTRHICPLSATGDGVRNARLACCLSAINPERATGSDQEAKGEGSMASSGSLAIAFIAASSLPIVWSCWSIQAGMSASDCG